MMHGQKNIKRIPICFTVAKVFIPSACQPLHGLLRIILNTHSVSVLGRKLLSSSQSVSSAINETVITHLADWWRIFALKTQPSYWYRARQSQQNNAGKRFTSHKPCIQSHVSWFTQKRVADRDVNDARIFQPCSMFMFRRKSVELNCLQFGGYKNRLEGSL